MKYDELLGNLIAYEQNHINRYNNNNKKKYVAFTVETSDIGEEVNEYQSERLTLINKWVKQILRQRIRRPQHDFNNNEFQRNDAHCYYCEKSGHIKQNYKERRRRRI